MTAQQYFFTLQQIQAKIENKENRLARIMESVSSPAVGELKKDKVQSSTPLDKQERMITEAVVLEGEIQELYVKLKELRGRIARQIDNMDNPVYSRILSLRIEGDYILRDIAKILYYNESYTRLLYRQALKAFEKQYADELKKPKR